MSDQLKALGQEPISPANELDPANTAGVSGSDVGNQANLLQLVKQMLENQQKVNEALLENQQKVTEALLENQQEVKEALLENQQEVKEALHDIKEALKARPEDISISEVSWGLANSILQELNITMEDGHEIDPLEMDSTKFPNLPHFSMADFPGEEAATPSALEYIQRCLEKHGVKFGRDGFKLVDTHRRNNLYELSIRNKLFHGGVDGMLIPYGIAGVMPQMQMRAAIELMHSPRHKALYEGNALRGASSAEPQGTTFSGIVRGQALLEALAGLVRTEHPEIMLLLTDIDFNTLIKYEAATFTIWEDISFNQAIHKLAEFLNSCSVDRKYNLVQAMRSMSEAAAAALEPTVELRKRLRPSNPLLLEQLESVLDPDMSFNESLATALQLIQAHRACHEECSTSSDSWKCMFG